MGRFFPYEKKYSFLMIKWYLSFESQPFCLNQSSVTRVLWSLIFCCDISTVLKSVIYSDKSCTKTRNTSQHECTCFDISSPSHKRQPPQLAVKAKISRDRTCTCQSESRRPSCCFSSNGSIIHHVTAVAYPRLRGS